MSEPLPLRFSALKHIAKSPMHVRHYLDNGRDDKPWLRGGRGLHCVLFDQPHATFNGAARRGKEWDAFCAMLQNEEFAPEEYRTAEVILAKELPVYEAQAAAIRAELYRQDLSYLLDGDVEKRIEWEWLGRRCGGTPDVAGACPGVSVKDTWITDVKTTCNADPRRFHWDARKFAYAEQLEWYRRGVSIARHGTDAINYDLFVIAVEKVAPYPVVIWRVTDKMREQAERTVRLWMEQFLACEASDVWPGYAQTVQQFDVLESEGLTLQIEGEEVEVE